METSKLLGILSLCYSFVPFIGIATGLIGLSQLKKSDKSYDLSIKLNIAGLILSILIFIYNLSTMSWY